MKIETYKKGIKLKYIGIGAVVSVLLLIPLVINTTKAKYQTSQSVPLIRGKINFKQYDFKIMAMYQENDSGEYEEVEVMPSSGYTINEKESYCYTVTQEERDDTAVLYTNDQGQHVVENLKKASKCYLWFDKIDYTCNGSACETIMANKRVAYMPSITGVSSDTSNTLYSVADDDGDSYVFRGNPSNNWVEFGGFYWRIIRINGDGSIRMIYNGTNTEQTGEGTQIDGSTYAYNSRYNDNAYVGFMYGEAGASTYAATHANTNNSTIKGNLDSWYTNSGLSNYAEFIDINAGFCNDRKIYTGSSWSEYGTLGYGTNAAVYAPTSRFLTWNNGNSSWATTQTPTLKCSQASNDLFTHTSSDKGNNKLTNPIGIITADEVVLAGGFAGTDNTSYYLYTNQNYWTLSPYRMNTSGYAHMFSVYSSGKLNASNVNGTIGIRPVINLRSDVTLTGDGTVDNIYKVS